MGVRGRDPNRRATKPSSVCLRVLRASVLNSSIPLPREPRPVQLPCRRDVGAWTQGRMGAGHSLYALPLTPYPSLLTPDMNDVQQLARLHQAVRDLRTQV